jgi:alkaline phosphatase
MRNKLPLRRLLSLTLVAGLHVASSASAAEVKNVIVLIPDGQSTSIQTLGRWFRGEPLALDEMGAGTMATWMVNSITTDSAPAATAMATGYKSTDKFISVGPIEATALTTYQLPDGIPWLDNDQKWNWFSYRPLATVLEGAKRQGKATGLISTSRITHATPAGYGAHVDSRSLENDIAEQLVYQNLDVVFGGGWDRMLPTPDGSRTDGENLLEVLKARGYQWVENKAQLALLSGGRAWGLFAKEAMLPDIDRRFVCEQTPPVCDEPTLAEMTAKAIDLLALDEDGFILMIEGSQVDWAGHNNDPAYMMHDFLAFDDAVRVALDFAKANPDTIILAAPDHNTGGLSLGNRSTDNSYVSVSVEQLLDPVRGMKTTSGYIRAQLGETPTSGDIKEAVSNYWGIALSDEEVAAIVEEAKSVGYAYAIANIVSKGHTVFGWTTYGHTGEDVPFWSYGASAPVGHIDNTDFAWTVAEVFGLNLNLGDPAGLNQALFVDVKDQFSNTTSNVPSANPVLTVVRNRGQQFDLPANKDYLIWRAGKSPAKYCKLDGVIIYAPKADDSKGRWFAPQTAIDVIRTPGLCNR